MNTVITAEKINKIVAKIDLKEKILIPITPWPLVQPLPTLVPIPTNNPPIIIRNGESVTVNGIELLLKNITNTGPKIKPITKRILINLLVDFIRMLLAKPLTPANLPVAIKKRIIPTPINKPPIVELYGVKLIKSNLITN